MQDKTDTKLVLNAQGYFELRWSERAEDGSGWRSKRVSTRTHDRAEAEAFRREYLTAQQDTARRPGGPVPTVGEIIDGYLKGRSDVGDSQKLVLARVRRALGGLVLAELTEPRLADYRAQRGISGPSVRRELGALIAAVNRAVKTRAVRPEDVPFIELPPVGAPRDLWLNEEQEAEYHGLAMGNSVGAPRLTRVTRFVALALDTAARKEAIHELTWDRVDLERGLIDFRRPGQVQTNKRRVPVPVSDRLGPVLARAHAEWVRDGKPDPYVIGQGDVRTAFETWRAGTPYEWATAHVLRHTWATLAARAGVPIWQIAGVLGDDPRTVEKNYLHHCPEHLRDAVNRRAG
jgi:integrase